MPIQPVKIPQNVYIEDRIVGPLTLRQIITVAVGGGFSYAMWASLSKSYGFLPLPITVLVWVPGVLSVIFAFVRINDISMMRLLFLMVERINKPYRRTWTPRRGLTINIRTFTTPDQERENKRKRMAAKDPSHLDEISTVLDTADHGDSPDVDQVTVVPAHPTAAATRPVDRKRVEAEPIEQGGGTLDGVEPKPSVSIFRDIKPR